jgi:uncharacterized membrane protein AbrB (regulator of aidB expression)
MRNAGYNIVSMNKRKKLKLISKNVILFVFVSIIILITSDAFNIYLFSRFNEIINADAAVILGGQCLE